jgi:hypothetical protein
MSEILDLSSFDVRPRAEEGAEMPLLDPSGNVTKVVFRVRGIDSMAYQEKLKAQLRRRKEILPRKPSEAELNAETIELYATLVCAWSVDGKPAALIFEKGEAAMECTPANVARVLEQHSWIFEQVIEFAGKRANFLPGSASS